MKEFIQKLEDNGFKYKSYENDDILIINGDCLKVMELMEDNSIQLVLADPPYGIGFDKQTHKASGIKAKNSACAKGVYKDTDWDSSIPSQEIFDNLVRVGIDKILWGGEHICNSLPQSRGWIVWDKDMPDNNFSDCELAWTSYAKPIKRYKWTWNGMIQQDMKNKEVRVHPTQKPTGLFKMILEDYSKENDLIFDGFLGSGTTALACLKTNRRCIGVELDEDYFEIACKRIEKQLQSPTLFGGF